MDGHCIIVPVQHYVSSLELDDDDWEEIKVDLPIHNYNSMRDADIAPFQNFMKCLMQMFAKQNQGVLFFETVLPTNIKYHNHTYIEAIPMPANLFADAPAYFRESILASESEWSQHKKLIDFSERPGGFRRSMVPNLPYFAVQWDHKGEKGYGHIIEGMADGAGGGGLEEEEAGMVHEGDKGGGEMTR